MKGFKLLVIGLLCIALFMGGVSAAGNANFLNLVEKTPVDVGPYTVVEGGAFGKLMYKDTPKPMFVFNAHGLNPDQEYALISYAEPWGTPCAVQGVATADEMGNIHIKGQALDLITNTYPTPTSDEYSGDGAKIWLVPTADFDVDTGLFSAWNPTEYLFETALI